MKVYVVLQEDYNLGADVVGVYEDQARAEAVVRGNEGYWYFEKDLVLEADCVDVAE